MMITSPWLVSLFLLLLIIDHDNHKDDQSYNDKYDYLSQLMMIMMISLPCFDNHIDHGHNDNN